MIENSENELSKKQEYLRIEIMEKGFDTELFTENMQKEKGENALELENWTFEELKQFVEKFQKENQIEQKNDEDINKIENKEENNNNIDDKKILINPIKQENKEGFDITTLPGPPTAGEAFQKMINLKSQEKKT